MENIKNDFKLNVTENKNTIVNQKFEQKYDKNKNLNMKIPTNYKKNLNFKQNNIFYDSYGLGNFVYLNNDSRYKTNND